MEALFRFVSGVAAGIAALFAPIGPLAATTVVFIGVDFLSGVAADRAVAADTGIDPDEPLDTLDPATMIPLAAAISRVENGTAADRGEIERGWALFSD